MFKRRPTPTSRRPSEQRWMSNGGSNRGSAPVEGALFRHRRGVLRPERGRSREAPFDHYDASMSGRRSRAPRRRERQRGGMRVVVSGVSAREFRAFSQKHARAQDAGKTAVAGSPAASHADLALSRRTIIPKPVRRVVLCPHYVSSRHRPYHAHWRRSCKIVSSSPSFMFR